MSRDWALGGKEFRQDLVKEHQERLTRLDLGEGGVLVSRELFWEDVLQRYLQTVGKGMG